MGHWAKTAAVIDKHMTDQTSSQEQATNDALFDIDFADQLENTFADGMMARGSVVKGLVTAIEGDVVHIDIGMKAEGRVPLKEFYDFGKESTDLKVGDAVDVFVENLDNKNGEAQLSREKAQREEVLDTLEAAHKADENINGIIFGKVKGGFMVDVQGILGFMPGSQLDARPVLDPMPYMHNEQELKIVKMDRDKNNVIVSRRAVQDEQNAGDRAEILNNIEEGQKLQGIVKNITEYGAFIDLGGIDGLLHITDMAWQRVQHPSELIKVGDSVDVMVTRFDQDSGRVSLGMKQLQEDPWVNVDQSFPLESRIQGKITNITDYGAFVELAPGIEGLIHVSEMSWTRKNIHPSKLVSEGEEVEVMVLEIDRNKRRISLGLKQCRENPWQHYAKEHKVGDTVEGTVRSLTDFGVFVALTEDIDGLVHVSDLSWEQSPEDALAEIRKGDMLQAVILAVDPEKERIALGVKQLTNDPFATISETYKKGQRVNVTITDIQADGITVTLDGFEAFIRTRDLGVDKSEQDPFRYKEGSTIEAKLTNISKADRRINLSVKALQLDEEKAAVAEYAEADDDAESPLAAALKEAGVAKE